LSSQPGFASAQVLSVMKDSPATVFTTLPHAPREPKLYQPRKVLPSAARCAIGSGSGMTPMALDISLPVVAMAMVAHGIRGSSGHVQFTRRSAAASRRRSCRWAGNSALRRPALQQRVAQESGAADAASEIAALEREAARLRAGAAELEAVRAAGELAERRRVLSRFDTDGSGGVDAAELRRGMREELGMEVDEGDCLHVLARFDRNGSGELELDEFDVERVRAALERRWAGDPAEEARRARAARDGPPAEDGRAAPEGSQHDGVLVRIGCALPYLLPLLDGVTYGLPLALQFPQLLPVVTPLVLMRHSLESVPFGSIACFLCMQHLSRQEWVPAPLRYSLDQATALDVRICLFGLFFEFGPQLISYVVPFTQEDISDGVISTAPTAASLACDIVFWNLAALAFLLLAACIAYNVAGSLIGYAPQPVPIVLQEDERSTALTSSSKEQGDHDSRV